VSGGSINVADVVAVLRAQDQLSPVVRSAMQMSVQEVGRLQTAVSGANKEVRDLQQTYNSLPSGSGGGNFAKQLELEIGAATIKAQALQSQLSNVKSEINAAFKPPETNGDGLPQWLSRAAEGVGAYVGGLFAFAAIMGTVRGLVGSVRGELQESIGAWAEQEAQTFRLTAALKAQGMAIPSVLSYYDQLADRYQRTTVFADDQINKTQALLVQIGDVMPKDMDRALQATTNLAAGLGVDLESAARLVGKAFEGNYTALQRYGISINQAKIESEGIEAVLDAINTKFGGQAQAQAETYAGRVQQIANAWNNVQEAMGRFLVQNPAAIAFVNGIADATDRLDKSANGSGIPHLIASFASWIPIGQDVAGFNQRILDTWAAMSENEDWMSAALDAFPVLDVATREWLKGLIGVQEATGLIRQSLKDLKADGAIPAIDWKATLRDGDKLSYVLQDITFKQDKLTESQKQAAVAAFNHGLSVQETIVKLEAYWPEVQNSKLAVEALHKGWTDGREEAKKFAEAARNITDVLSGQGVVWDGTTEQALKFGASVSDLSTYLGQSKGEIEAVKLEMKQLEDAFKIGLAATKEWRAAIEKKETTEFDRMVASYIDGMKAINKAGSELADLQNQRSLSSTNYEIAQIEHWADEAKRAFKGTAEEAERYYALIDREAEQKIGNLYVDWGTLRTQSTASLQETADRAYTTYLSMKGRSDEFSKAAIDHQKAVADAAQRAADGVLVDWKSTFLQLADVFEHAFEGGGGLAGAMKSAGVLLGKTLTQSMVDEVRKAFGAGGSQSVSGAMGAAAGVGALAGAGAEASGASGGQAAGAAVGAGASAGVAAGMAAGELSAGIAVGAATMGIGLAVVGAIELIKYLMRDKLPAEVAVDAGRVFGQKWSDALQQSIVDKAHDLHDRVAGELASLPAIIKEHPIDASNLEMYTGKVHDLFSMLQTAKMSTVDVQTTLNAVFPALAAAATDATGAWSSGLKDIIRLNQEAGLSVQSITDALKAQGKTAIDGFVAVAAGLQPETNDWVKLKTSIDLLKIPVKDLTDAQKSLMDSMHLTAGDTKLLNIMLGQQKDLAGANKQELADLGTQAVASFAAAVASGTSEKDALAAIHPALQTLEASYASLGLGVDDVALSALMMRDKIVTAAPQLVSAIGGLSTEMTALDNMGLMNVSTFESMERTGVAMYQKLVDQVKALGGTDKDALSEMQGFLHKAADEAKALGVPLDDNTQALIDQSKNAGIWQDALTPQDKLLKGMQSLVDKVGDLVDRLNGIPPKIDTTVTTHYVKDVPDPKFRNDDNFGGQMAEGGDFYVTKPTWFLAGEKPGGEFASFSGAGKSMGSGRGKDDDIIRELKTLNNRLAFVDTLPDDITRAVKAGVQLIQ
jgi:hypothetical protein